MSTLTLFAITFVVLLILGGWITSEVISSRTTKSNKKYTKQLALLDRENAKLQKALAKENDRYTMVKEEYDKLRDAKAQIRTLEIDYKKLNKKFKHMSNGIDELRQKVSSKKYHSNSLAKEVIVLLDERFPSDQQRAERETQGTKDTFKRIKETIGGLS